MPNFEDKTPKIFNNGNTLGITRMYKTKVTSKGQITLPRDFLKKLKLKTGSVVVVDIKNHGILVNKPKFDLKKVFGAWSDLKANDVRKMKNIWRGWDEKAVRGL